MLNVIRFVKGYVKIEIYGVYAEKILSVCAKNGIRLFNIRCKRKCITAYVTVKDFMKIKDAKRGIKAKIKIVKKCGLPFMIQRYKKRTGFFAGLAVFFIILEIMSLFVWNISIKGNTKTKKSEILGALEELGIKEGTFSYNIDPEITAQRLLLKCGSLNWASVNIEGSFVTVNVNEEKKKLIKTPTYPSNLLASADGIIEKIDVLSGETAVKVGDPVKKGDLLVSGTKQTNNSTLFLASVGKITAKTVREYKKSGKYYSSYSASLPAKTYKTLFFYGVKVPLFLRSPKEPYIIKSKSEASLFGGKVPVRVKSIKVSSAENKKIRYSLSGLKAHLNREIDKEIKKSNIKDYKTLSTKTIKEKDGLTVIRTVTAEENIAKRQKILIN